VRIVTATSGPDALRLLLAEPFAVVLLDVQMPGMDGFETASLIKRHPRTAATPIIFVTASHRDSDGLFQVYETGAVDYMLKPFEPGILRSKVRAFVDLYQRERRVKEQEFRAVLDSMPLCVWALDAEGNTRYRNRSCLEYAGEGDAGGPFDASALIHPDDAGDVQIQWARALACGQPLEVQYRLRRARDGSYRWHVGRVVPQHGPNGDAHRVTGWIVTATDIESQKRAEGAYARLVVEERQAREEAQAANRAKDEFLATLSHELRTPLNAMIGWTRMLRTRKLAPDKVGKALETIERNARAQAELIEDILDVSRIITGKLRIEIRAVDLAAIVDAAVESVRPAAEAKQIALGRRIGELAPRLQADPARLQQVIWNLLSNAIKFTPPGGRVGVDVEAADGEVVIRVTDTGRGIHPDFKPFVFDRFRQLDSSSKRAHGGLGLGLAIVRHLVELHGGTVACESAGEGQGATFVVRLPARAGDVQTRAVAGDRVRAFTPGPPADEGSVSLAGVRVLLVDDEPDARELLTEVLEQYGARVASAASADEALAFIERERPDVVLSDIGLPGEDGYALIGRLRALPPDRGGVTPAAAITAYARSDDARRALAAGYQRHAPKPIQPLALARLVHDLHLVRNPERVPNLPR